jgi:simple sugar transport system permease protein
LRGAEGSRLRESKDSRINNRIYFYDGGLAAAAAAPLATAALLLGPALQAVGIQAGYHLWNAAPYVLTLAIMLASTSKARASIGAPGELSMTR